MSGIRGESGGFRKRNRVLQLAQVLTVPCDAAIERVPGCVPKAPSGLLALSDMTGSSKSSDGLDPRRRKLLFRAWHRGSREMDLVMGPFADAWIDRLSEDELAEFERLVAMPDPELFSLVVDSQAEPEQANALLARLRAFHSGTRDPR